MPTDPSGNYSLPPSYFATPGTPIRTEQHNPIFEDVAQGITGRLMRDGRNGMVGVLDMGDFPIRNLQDGTNATDAATVGQVNAAAPPIGSVIDYAPQTAPIGWLMCFGQAVSRTTYPALFAAIGVVFGAGDGTTTFNVPDLRGRVTAGKDNMGGTAADRLTAAKSGIAGNTLGAAGGNEVQTLTEAQLPAHTHAAGTLLAASAGAHTHELQLYGGGSATVTAQRGGGGPVGPQTTSSDGVHTHPITGATAASGTGAAHNNAQPTLVLNKIIRAL